MVLNSIFAVAKQVKVKSKSSNNDIFEVDKVVVLEMETIWKIIKDTPTDAPIPMLNVPSKILSMVIEYCKHTNIVRDCHLEYIEECEKELMDCVDNSTLFSLTLAADYLGITKLFCMIIKSINQGHLSNVKHQHERIPLE